MNRIRVHDKRIELKYIIPKSMMASVFEWANRTLSPDPFASPTDHSYLISSVYLDTEELDIFSNSSGNEDAKYRIRRYGCGSEIWFERKRKRKFTVDKQRALVVDDSILQAANQVGTLGDSGDKNTQWFIDHVHQLKLQPIVAVQYKRFAWIEPSHAYSNRLTIDTDLRVKRHLHWSLPEINDPELISSEAPCVLELKFSSNLPTLFKQFLSVFDVRYTSYSKYRTAIQACVLPKNCLTLTPNFGSQLDLRNA
ncbi:MAG: polyphosphate polymerase domain-containing protein [Pirellulaceae bacterium]